MDRRCVALISGGLDSALAARLMLNQGIDVRGLYLSVNWGCCDKDKAVAVSQQLGIPLMVLGVGEAYLDVIRKPTYGYGTALNPCVDCRIYMFLIAKRYMDEVGAGFIVTGEVVGQRPMSQMRRPLSIIEEQSGLQDRLLRPLSAQLLEPTLPERLGIVDREQLLRIAGRSRQEQLALAKDQGITEFSTPAGGCLLTDQGFAKKAKDLFDHDGDKTKTKDMELLSLGRHFRVGEHCKIILGRNELENIMLEGHADVGYTCIRPKFAGPTALVCGACDEEASTLAVSLIVRFTKDEKLPAGPLELWRDGTPWVAQRPEADVAMAAERL